MKTQKNLPVNWCSIDIFIKEYQMRLVWGEWRCQVAREVSTTSNHTNDLHRFHWNVKGDVICQRVQLLFTKKGRKSFLRRITTRFVYFSWTELSKELQLSPKSPRFTWRPLLKQCFEGCPKKTVPYFLLESTRQKSGETVLTTIPTWKTK